MKNIHLEHLQQQAQLRREFHDWLYACTVAGLLGALVAGAVWGHAYVSMGVR